MSLPKPTTPIYTISMHSGQKVKIKPWDGHAEKSLQIALMDEDKTTIRNTMLSVIDECTFNALDVENLPEVEIEWLITQLRLRSVGEIVELTATCSNCTKQYDVNVNLLEAVIEDNSPDRKKPIKVDDDIYFQLRLPTKEMMTNYENDKNFSIDHLVASMIVSVSTSEEVFSPKDYSFEELVQYVEGFNKQKMIHVYKFIEDLPRVVCTTKSTCRHCKTEHDIRLEGTDFFFV